MPIRFHCICGHEITARDRDAGQQGRCPGCWEPVLIPGVPEPPPPPPPEPRPSRTVAFTVPEAREPAAESSPSVPASSPPARREGRAWELAIMVLATASGLVAIAGIAGLGPTWPRWYPIGSAALSSLTIAVAALAILRRTR
jgi:hypothetical protein